MEENTHTPWQQKTMLWALYPLGTRARQSWMGSYWTRTERGWQSQGGDTFPYPSDSDQVSIPL